MNSTVKENIEVVSVYEQLLRRLSVYAPIKCLCAYMIKEWDKILRRPFGAHEMNKNLLQEQCSKLKAWITKVESTMKETLESIDKLQTNLDEANTTKLALEKWAKILQQ